jgi:ABC-type nickel/cobalt efflux system permease component RcnA
MSNELLIFMGTALSIGFFDTIFGPDHYLPFIVMSKARQCNMFKTAVITLLCGIGHVLSSVILGFIGIAFGVAVFKLEFVESFRGELAVWLLLAFGFTYFVWGLRRAVRDKSHSHLHEHNVGKLHDHSHKHSEEYSNPHDNKNSADISFDFILRNFETANCQSRKIFTCVCWISNIPLWRSN